MTCPYDLLIAASSLGLRGVRRNGEIVVETPDGKTVASSDRMRAPVRIVESSDRIEVVVGATRFITSDPCTAIVASYNAYTDYLLYKHRAKIERVYQILASRKPGDKCGEWAGRVLGVEPWTACRLAILAASIVKACETINVSESCHRIDEGLDNIVEGVARLSSAREIVLDAASVLASIGEDLLHSRAGQVIAGRLLGFNPYHYAAVGYNVCRLIHPSTVHVKDVVDGRGIVITQELAWCSRSNMKLPGDPLAHLLVLLSRNGLDYPASSPESDESLRVCASTRCKKPYIDVGGGLARRALTASLQGEKIIVYIAGRGEKKPRTLAALHGYTANGVKDVGCSGYLEAVIVGFDESMSPLDGCLECWNPV